MVAAAALVAMASSQATATVIVFDGFTNATSGNAITGRDPAGAGNGGTNLPGASWVRATNQLAFTASTAAGFGDPTPGTSGSANAGSAISIATSLPYEKPTLLRVSADIAPRTLSGGASAGRGFALGFYSTVGTGQIFSQNRFTGLVLDNAGNLNLVHDPNETGFFTGPGVFLGTPIAFSGTWDANTLRTLSYDIDTTTGEISNISLGGSSAAYSFTTSLFTDAATTFAGMYSSSETVSQFGALDNFQVVAVPEPGTLALLGFGAMAAWGLCRNRGRSASAKS